MSIATLRSAPTLRLAVFDDYPQVTRLEASNDMDSLPADDWQNLWLRNPVWERVRHDWPIGWVLETDEGQLVGSLFNIPSLYSFQGRELICANGRGWVVAPDYRGLSLWLMGEYFGQTNVDLFVNTTVGPNAAPMIASLAECVPLGDFQTVAYRPIRYRRFAEKQLRNMGVPAAGLVALPAAAALRIKAALQLRSFPSTPASITIESVAAFDYRFDAFWIEQVRQNPDKLLGLRDAQTLAWHYSAAMRHGHVWILTASRQGLLRAFCVLKRTDLKLPMRRMRLVDFQTLDPHDNLLPGLLRFARRRAIAESIDVIEHLGCGLPKMRDFEVFSPYRRAFPCQPYYYRAANAELAKQLARPAAWDPSTYDGDSSLDLEAVLPR
jgi:hypothetical protein